MDGDVCRPVRIEPRLVERVWGGQRLRPGGPPVGEAWLVDEEKRIVAGPGSGSMLGELASAWGERLLGRRAVARTGSRFPLLIKLIDAAEWLSVQVHPDDAAAVRLEGPGHVGKTEAWHVLAADPGAELIAGVGTGTSEAALAAAIRGGTILDLVERHPVQAGDTLYLPAGTVHALGPGVLVYEVQQSSDLTYRVYDWDRPPAAGRALHVEQSVAVADSGARAEPMPAPVVAPGGGVALVRCPYFRLDLLAAGSHALALDPAGESFHALTVVDGEATLEGDAWSEALGERETAVVPAACGAYRLAGNDAGRVLLAQVE